MVPSDIRGWGLEAGLADRLERFVADLLRWGRAQNLVSRREPRAEVEKQLLESLQVARWLSGQAELVPGPWADVGSGAGFPGLVLACAFPDQAVDLVERRQGRCDFLRREVAALALGQVRVLETDARRLSQAPGPYALVTLKAVAPPAEALELARPLLAEGGRALLFQRPRWEAPETWTVAASWRGEEGPIDLSRHATFLLSPDAEA